MELWMGTPVTCAWDLPTWDLCMRPPGGDPILPAWDLIGTSLDSWSEFNPLQKTSNNIVCMQDLIVHLVTKVDSLVLHSELKRCDVKGIAGQFTVVNHADELVRWLVAD